MRVTLHPLLVYNARDGPTAVPYLERHVWCVSAPSLAHICILTDSDTTFPKMNLVLACDVGDGSIVQPYPDPSSHQHR